MASWVAWIEAGPYFPPPSRQAYRTRIDGPKPRRTRRPHRRGAGAPGAAAAGGGGPRLGRCLRLASLAAASRPGGQGVAGGHRAAARRGAAKADPAGQHAAVRPRPAGEQRHAVGRARHGQIVAGEGGARGRQHTASAQPGAGGDPPRGRPLAAGPAERAARPGHGAA